MFFERSNLTPFCIPCELSVTFICIRYTAFNVRDFTYRKKETAPPAKKLPAVPESVLKRRKTRLAVKAASLQTSIKVLL